MRVLQLISSAGFYGAESMLLNLITACRSDGQSQQLAVIYNRHIPNQDLYDRAIAAGVKAILIPCQGRWDWSVVEELRRLLRSGEIDILHTHGYKADLYGYIAARREGKPIIATCHNWLSGGMLSAYNLVDRILLRRFDAVVGVSQPIADRLSVRKNCTRVHVIANGIDVSLFSPAPTGAFDSKSNGATLGMVARLDLQKGFECLFDAIAALRADFPALRLLVVGEGPDRQRIEAMIRGRDLNGVVTLVGEQSDMPRVYASMDIFVLPSLNEGLPMTVLEAMAASRPIIATRVGAIPTVVRDGETGVLVNPGDPADLKSAISRLLSDPQWRSAIGKRARAHVERNYTAAIMGQKYDQVYRGVLDAAAGHREIGSPLQPAQKRARSGGPGSSDHRKIGSSEDFS